MMLRINSTALRHMEGQAYLDGGLFTGLAFDLIGYRIVRRTQYSLGDGAYVDDDPFLLGTPNSTALSFDDPRFDDYVDGTPWYVDDGPFTGRIIEFDGIHQTAETAIVAGQDVRRVDFYRGGKTREQWRRDGATHLSGSWWEDDELQSFSASVVAGGAVEQLVEFRMNELGKATSIVLRGDFVEKGLTLLRNSNLDINCTLDQIISRGMSSETRLDGLLTGSLLTALLDSNALDGVERLILDNPRLRAADLHRICASPSLRTLRILGDRGDLASAAEFVRRQRGLDVDYRR